MGRAVYEQLKENGNFKVTGTGYSRAEEPLIKLDLKDKDAVKAFVMGGEFDWIIHCAAERRPDVSEVDPAGSEELNVDVTGMLAGYAAKLGAAMLYISTDYVFDGTNPPYYPDCPTKPLNFYGRTKLAGEEAVKAALENYIILRVPVLYGTETYPLEASVSSVAASLMENRGGTFDDVAVRYPTHTMDVARVIKKMIECKDGGEGLRGIYHFSGDGSFTKYGMALVMADILGIDKECISPDKHGSGGADRPVNSHLDTGELKKIIPFTLTPFAEGIKPVLERFFGE